MRILFVRHGHPDYATDTLTPLGHRQAEAAAERLMREKIDRIFSSSCGRAQQTAAHTAARLGLPIETLDFMREIKSGLPMPPDTPEEEKHRYYLWPHTEQLLLEGADMAHLDCENDPLFSSDLIKDQDALITENIDKLLASLGYPREGHTYRAAEPNDQTIALFSHGGSSSLAMAHILNLPLPSAIQHFCLYFTSISEIGFDAPRGQFAQPRIHCLGDRSHIYGDLIAP